MKTAFIFPGQGSQSVGMLSKLAKQHAIVEQTFSEASAVLGYDLWDLVSNGPETDLNSTEKTQPALLAAGVAVWRVLSQTQDLNPSMMAGHSLGEYSALVCAGALEFTDGISLVADRGRFMQQSVPAGKGAMAAILGLEDQQVADICADTSNADSLVSCANYNSPGQIVIAGEHTAVERVIEALKEAGAKRALMLAVSVPSHCQLMKPAATNLQARLEQISISTPTIPVLHNVDAKPRSDTSAIKQALVEQLYLPVRWVDVMNAISTDAQLVIEAGPGKVLAGLAKRINRQINCQPVFDPASLEKALT